MLLSVAEQVRTHYLKGYLHCLQEFQFSHEPSAPEILFEIPRDAPRAFRFYRVDMGSNSNGQLTVKEVNLETHLEFEPFQAHSESDLKVMMSPIAWDSVEFRGRLSKDTTLLEQWTIKWLDVDDKNHNDEHGLQGVIHSVTPLAERDGLSGFCVDFGSAPVLALSELLVTFVGMSARSIEIYSSCLG